MVARTGGVCRQSLTAEKILFTGRQTCSLYLVLSLCGEESDAIFPDRSVQRHSMTSLETVRSLANGPSLGGGGAEGEVCILRSPGIAASPISLLSMGGVCGRSLTARGENSLHRKANVLPLFSIMSLWCDCLEEFEIIRFHTFRIEL